MFDAVADGLVVTGENGQIVFVNRQLEQMTGHERATLLGQAIEVLIPDTLTDRHRLLRAGYQAAPRSRAMGEAQILRARRVDGSELPIEVSLAPVEIDGHRLTVASVRDVTARRDNDHARRRLLHLLDLAPDAVLVGSYGDSRLEHVNLGAVALLGYGREELLSLRFDDIISAGAGTKGVLDVLASESTDVVTFDADLLDRSGQPVPCQVRALRVPDDEPAGGGKVILVARDDRQRRSAAAKLKFSEAAFRNTFEQAPVGMIVTTLDGSEHRQITRTNKAFADFLGTTIEQILGASPAEFSHAEDDALDQIATEAQLRGEQPSYTLEKRYRRSDGTDVWGELHTTILDDDGEPTRTQLSHVIDVSNRKADEERRASADQLRGLLTHVATDLLADVGFEKICERVVRSLAHLIGASAAVIWLRREQANADRVICGLGEDFGLLPNKLKTTDLAGSDAPRRIANSEGGTLIALLGMRSKQAVMFAASGPGFSSNDTELLDQAGRELRLLFELAEARADQRRLELIEDRERIGRDLHDTVIQELFAAGMQLTAGLSSVTDELLRDRFNGVIEQIDDSIRQLRGAVFDLHQNTSGLRTASEEVLATTREASRVLHHNPHVELHGDVDELEDVILAQLLPTLREALSNVARHARATATTIVIDAQGTEVVLTVQDNGVGVGDNPIRGSGIMNMEERARALGGATLTTAPTVGGTCFRWQVPRRRQD